MTSFVSPDLITMEINLLKIPTISDEVSFYNEDASLYSLQKTIKAMINKIIIRMKEYGKKLKTDIEIGMKKHHTKKELHALKAQLQSGALKNKTIKFPNIAAAIDVYRDGIKKLSKRANHILNKKYKNYDPYKVEKNIDYDIEEFIEQLDDFEDEVDKALSDTLNLKGKAAIAYIDSFEKGTDYIYKAYFDAIHQFEKFKIEAEADIKVKAENQDMNFKLSEKKVGALTKLSNKLSSCTRKMVVRTVFFIA